MLKDPVGVARLLSNVIEHELFGPIQTDKRKNIEVFDVLDVLLGRRQIKSLELY